MCAHIISNPCEGSQPPRPTQPYPVRGMWHSSAFGIILPKPLTGGSKMKGIIRAAIATALAAAGAYAEDITYPVDSTLTFSGGTSYTESGNEWGEKHENAATALKVSVTGTGNTINGISKEANPWRNVTLTGDGYLTMIRDGQWSIGMSDNPGSIKDFEGTLHIQHIGYNTTYFGIDSNKLSFEKGSIILEAGTGNTVYFSNYAATRKIGDLSTAGDNPSRISVRKKNDGTLYIGYLGKNSTFGGRFENEGTTQFDMVKVGTGVWTLNGEIAITIGTFTVQEGTAIVDCHVACAVAVGSGGSLGGSGTINGTVSASTGAKLLFDADDVLTFTDAANLNGFTVDATGCTVGNEYLVAKGTTSLPGVSAAQSAQGWMTEAKDGNVYLVNRMTVIDANVTLDADTDWTATPVSVADNVTIDLNGHNLSVAGITLGSSVAFVNNGAERSRIYAGLNGADKSWLLGLNLAENIIPVFCGAAIEIPNTYVPAGGIGFKNTSGTQIVWSESCANGLAVLGDTNLKEPGNGVQNWNKVSDAASQFAVTIEGVNNIFTTDGGRYSSGINEFSKTPFIGDGEFILVSNEPESNFEVFGAGRNGSNFTGTLVLRAKSSLKKRNSQIGAALDASTTRVVISNDMSERTIANTFSLYTPSAWTKYSFSYGMIETAGEHPEIVALFMDYPVNDVHYDTSDMTLNIGGGNLSGAFAGDITNCVDSVVRNWDINKVGTGVWTLTGTVANGGTFTVAAGGVEFRGGLANVSSLSVASGASALFAGDMGSNPISLASGSTLKLDASNTGDDVPVVKGNLDLTGVNVYVSQGTYVPSKTEPRELIRVTGSIIGFNRNGVSADIDARGWSFRLVANEDGSKSIVHRRNPSFSVSLR